MVKWLEGPSKDDDVVISSRVRIARNLKNLKFPRRMSMEESDEVTSQILMGLKENLDDNYRFIRVRDLNDVEQQSFVESHLISPELLKNSRLSSFLIRDDEKVTIMINEEDHLRIQTLSPGFDLDNLWDLTNKIDDILDEKLEYAYDKDWGYLTACPTNVGTGLRASVMVHLPCITMTGNMDALINGLNKMGITTRGIYGEGSEALGSVYQISNQQTLGESEEEIIEKMEKIVKQIMAKERETRDYLKNSKIIDIEDRIYRSFGLLKHSRVMSAKEAMLNLTNIRTGWEMGIFEDLTNKEIERLIIDMQPASIQKSHDKDMNTRERDIARADMIREFMNDMEG